MKAWHFCSFGTLCVMLVFSACQNDDLAKPTHGDDIVTPRSHDCSTECIDPDDPVYHEHTGSVSNNSGPNTRIFNFTVYNTLSGFVLEWTYAANNNASRGLQFSVSGGGFSAAVTHTSAIVQGAGFGSLTFDFDTDWAACDVVNFVATIVDEEGDVIGAVTPTTGAYNLVGACAEVCYEDETAWADGDRYEDPGNWATYTEYIEDNTVTLYAGQTYDAGTVHFSAVNAGMVDITITLNPGFVFADDEENVKIQGYDSPPSGNPAPGLFDNKSEATSSPYTVSVAVADFYGVHVDVLRAVPCLELSNE